ncbi:MAG: glycosyltransferase family 39 protein [Anaerolineae bacterium]|nr:glycosyltransferase family 39 protein [Anaerolineae bacterium]MDH7474140.1 glycosyltransferase family 39 protein [Anaerolineae bacterium]
MKRNEWREKLSRREIACLVVILLVAAFFRFYQLGRVPPGFQFDETYNALDALRVLRGEWLMFFPANGGREPLYTYWQALFVALLGPTAFALRLSSAIVGVITVPVTYLLLRTIFPAEKRIAMLTTALLGVSFWHVHFSRYGIRTITLPLLEVLAYVFLWRGLQGGRWRNFVLSGIFLSATVYAQPAGRLIPLVMTAFVLYLALADRPHARRYLSGLLLTGIASFVVFLPLGYYFWRNPWAFRGHPGDVSIFSPWVNRGDVVRTLLSNTLKIAGMFTCTSDPEWIHGLPGRVAFDPLLAAFFVPGAVVFVHRLLRPSATSAQRAPYVLFLLWLVVMLSPSLLTNKAPNLSRTTGAIPIPFFIAALGLLDAWDFARIRWPGLARLGLGAVLVITTGWTYYDYFHVLGNRPETYYYYDVDKMDVAEYINRHATQSEIFLGPPWAQHPTVTLLTPDVQMRSFEVNAALVFPARSDKLEALYAFPGEQEDRIARCGKLLGNWAKREDVWDPQGKLLLGVYHLSAIYLPPADDPQAMLQRPDFPLEPVQLTLHRWGPLELVGFSAAQHERSLDVTLFWHALGPGTRDDTVFVHLLDGNDYRWGQADHLIAGGSYPAARWRAGDVIADFYRLEVDPCAPSGDYHLAVGLYDLTTLQRQLTDDGLNAVSLGPIPFQRARDLTTQDVPVESRTDAAAGDVLRLLGYQWPATEVEAGQQLPLTLYWQALKDLNQPLEAVIALIGEDGQVHELERTTVGGDLHQPWRQDEGICQRQQITIPPTLPGGDYRLSVIMASSELDLTHLYVAAHEPLFEVPSIQHPMSVDLDGKVRFLGYDLPQTNLPAGGTLHLLLYWQALFPMDTSYTVFVHLLDAGGQIRGQRDSVPVAGSRPTTSWVQDEVIVDEYDIQVDADAPPGRYQIEIGMYNLQTRQRLPAFDANGTRLPADRILLPTLIEVVAP